MTNGDSVLYYKDTVGTTGSTFSFPTSQERVVVKNLGVSSITYTIGSQTGSLGPSETIDVTETISQFTLTASAKTQAFEVWSDELGSNQSGTDLSSIMSQLADKATHSQVSDILTISVKDYFQTGDTDWTSVINRAITAIAPMISTDPFGTKPTLFFPYLIGSYATSSTITIPFGVNVVMESPILYMGTDGADILRIGNNTSYTCNAIYKLQVKRNTKTWAFNTSGIVIYNCNQCNIQIVQSVGSKKGVSILGDKSGFTYNYFNLQYLGDNQYHLYLNDPNNGWVNENIFLNGNFANTSFNADQARYAIQLDTTSGMNSNVFYKPSFEIGAWANIGVETIPVLIAHGHNNRFNDCRAEACGSILARLTGTSRDNRFSLTYTNFTMVLDDQGTDKMQNYIANATVQELSRPIYDSGFLGHKSYISKKAGTSDYKIGDLFALTIDDTLNVSNAKALMTTSAVVTINDKIVSFNNSIGIGRVFTSEVCKDFKIFLDIPNGSVGVRAYIIPYDINGNKLSWNDGTGKQYVKASSGIYTVTTYQNSYQLPTLTKTPRLFRVSAEVASFALVITRDDSTAGITLRRIQVDQIINTTNGVNDVIETSSSPFDWMNNGIYVTGVPTAGTWKKGQVLYELVPTIGQPSQYVVLTDGDFVTTTPTFGKTGTLA